MNSVSSMSRTVYTTIEMGVTQTGTVMRNPFPQMTLLPSV